MTSGSSRHTCTCPFPGQCAACAAQLKSAAQAAAARKDGKCSCTSCNQPRPAACNRIAELERELRLTHEQLQLSLDREQQLLRERQKLEHQLAVIRCIVCEGCR